MQQKAPHTRNVLHRGESSQARARAREDLNVLLIVGVGLPAFLGKEVSGKGCFRHTGLWRQWTLSKAK